MMKILAQKCLGLMLIFGVCLTALCLQPATAQADGWYWLSSDSKYSKYYDPKSVYTEESAKGPQGDTPIAVKAWTRTNYAYAGAKETIAAYKLQNVIPDPGKFAYSYAQVLVSPQNRTLQYMEEAFYDKQGNRLWHTTTPGSVKEINSQAFDETFYTAIVDAAFNSNREQERAKARDRWLSLWEQTTVDGNRISMMTDTTTLRLRGDNLIGWFWQETKDNNGAVLEIKFLKLAINLPQGSEKVVSGRYWSQQTGWTTLRDIDGIYRAIRKNTPKYEGLEMLRIYVQDHRSWVQRYQLEK